MSLAKYHAKSLLKKFGIKNVPVDPFWMAREMDIEVTEDDCESYLGMLLVVEGEALISIKSDIQEYSKKRFTVAHEIGHFSIPEHISPEKYFFCCTDKDLNTFDRKGGKEAEANAFAAELLMPEDIFREKIRLKDLSYDFLQILTSEFETSLTSTSIRFTELSGDYAMIVSENSCIAWFLKGGNFPYSVRGSGKLDKKSIAIEFFEGNTLPRSFELVPADAWLDDRKLKQEIEVKELSIPLKRYKQVLSFLYVEPTGQEYEDAGDTYLEELNGYLKFRK
jgi:Zn-dependent peptidase ImmA (M78 family)